MLRTPGAWLRVASVIDWRCERIDTPQPGRLRDAAPDQMASKGTQNSHLPHPPPAVRPPLRNQCMGLSWLAIGLLLASLSGCQTTRDRLAELQEASRLRTEQAIARSGLGEPKLADSRDQRAGARNESNDDLRLVSHSTATNSTDQARAASGSRPARQDAAAISERNRQLIDQYLSDATGEERSRWLQMAAKLDSTELELALNNRRPMPQTPSNGWGHTIDNAAHRVARPSPQTPRRRYADSRYGLPVITPGARRAGQGEQVGAAEPVANQNMSRIVNDQLEQITDQIPNAPLNQPLEPLPDRLNDPEPSQALAAPGPSHESAPTPAPPFNRGPQPNRQPAQRMAANERPLPPAEALFGPGADPLEEIEQLRSSIKPGNWQEELRKLINLTESDLAELTLNDENHDEYVRRHVNLRLMYLVAGNPSKAVQAIPLINAAEQEFWQQVLWSISGYFADQNHPNRQHRITESLSDLRKAIHRMRGQAKLQIRNMNFCSRISSFGVFDRVTEPRFRPGQQILVYTEIENFQSEEVVQDGTGAFKTKLSSTLELHRRSETSVPQEPVRTENFSPTVDLCASPRRDYFNAYTYVLPNDLPPGAYSLTLNVRDELGNGFASESLNFEVVR